MFVGRLPRETHDTEMESHKLVVMRPASETGLFQRQPLCRDFKGEIEGINTRNASKAHYTIQAVAA